MKRLLNPLRFDLLRDGLYDEGILLEVKNLLESDYPPPQVVALRPIRGCATADFVTYFQASLPLLCLKA